GTSTSSYASVMDSRCAPAPVSLCLAFFFSSRRRHTICYRDWSSDVCSSDLTQTRLTSGADNEGSAGSGSFESRDEGLVVAFAFEIGRASCRERGWIWWGSVEWNDQKSARRGNTIAGLVQRTCDKL